MQIYLSQSNLADLLGCHPQAISYRKANGLLPTPDVYIGNVITPDPPVPGWHFVRANMYRDWSARHCEGTSGRLNVDLRAQLPFFWDAQPEWYLSQREVGELIGLKRASVSHRRVRGTWPIAPVVRIGSKDPGTSGWDIAAVRDYGAQDRYLDAAGRIDTTLRRPGPRRQALAAAA